MSITVVKLGGSEGVNVAAFCEDVAALIQRGERLVVVHGASHPTNVLSEQLGHPAQFITSPSGHTSRRTDARTLEIMQMACRGLFNQQIVVGLQSRGVNAVGLSGVDGRLWEGTRKESIRAVIDGRTVMVRDDFTGTVQRVNAPLLQTLLNAGVTPVLCPPAISERHEAINVDADRAAAQTAAALGARSLLLLSNVPGLLKAYPDAGSLVPRVRRAEIEAFAHFAQGRMKKKVLGAAEALDAGVGRVVIADARVPGAVSGALAGAGTVFE